MKVRLRTSTLNLLRLERIRIKRVIISVLQLLLHFWIWFLYYVDPNFFFLSLFNILPHLRFSWCLFNKHMNGEKHSLHVFYSTTVYCSFRPDEFMIQRNVLHYNKIFNSHCFNCYKQTNKQTLLHYIKILKTVDGRDYIHSAW